jgi:hypothetical protein
MVSLVVRLGLLAESVAEDAIRRAAGVSPGGFRWVARAIEGAANRGNSAKGRNPTESWSYVTGTLRNWKLDDGRCPDGWPDFSAGGMRTASGGFIPPSVKPMTPEEKAAFKAEGKRLREAYHERIRQEKKDSVSNARG